MVTPLVVADGLGVDSTAGLCELHRRGIRPDAILFANTGEEKRETYEYIKVRRRWLEAVDFPDLVIVQNQVKDFKHWPPYNSLGQNCLTNGTLPSLAFGFKSCSLKWKVAPQNKWTDQWEPAIECWRKGGKVRKVIGYDASAKDKKRYAHAVGVEDPKYNYWYPLIEWGWDRDACKEAIRSDKILVKVAKELGQNPVPPKSACIFCPATQPAELHEHRKEYLRYIVIMEARAEPRLEGHIPQAILDKVYFETTIPKWKEKCAEAKAKGKVPPKRPRHPKQATGVLGLWRRGTKGTRGGTAKPGMMTDFIRSEGLLPAEEIEELRARAPKEIIDNQKAFATGDEIPDWHDFLEQFTPEDECDGCSCGPDLVQLM